MAGHTPEWGVWSKWIAPSRPDAVDALAEAPEPSTTLIRRFSTSSAPAAGHRGQPSQCWTYQRIKHRSVRVWADKGRGTRARTGGEQRRPHQQPRGVTHRPLAAPSYGPAASTPHQRQRLASRRKTAKLTPLGNVAKNCGPPGPTLRKWTFEPLIERGLRRWWVGVPGRRGSMRPASGPLLTRARPPRPTAPRRPWHTRGRQRC